MTQSLYINRKIAKIFSLVKNVCKVSSFLYSKSIMQARCWGCDGTETGTDLRTDPDGQHDTGAREGKGGAREGAWGSEGEIRTVSISTDNMTWEREKEKAELEREHEELKWKYAQ